MPTINITNLTANKIPVDSVIGSIPASSTITINLYTSQLEECGDKLNALETAGLISWVPVKSADIDDKAEFAPIALEGGSAKWTCGYGLPNATDLVPSAYADNGSGVVRVTVGSLGVPAIVTGSIVTIAGTTASHYVGSHTVNVINPLTIDLLGSVYIDNPAAKGTCTTSGVIGSIGDLFSCLDGGANTTLFVKETGTLTAAGWVGK